MKKLLTLFMMLTTLLPAKLSANPGYVYEGLTYDLWMNEDGKNYAELVDGKSASGDITLPDVVKTDAGGEFPLTCIGRYAFEGCTNITGVVIPDSVTEIGEGAFFGCSGITTLTIPESVIRIGEGAFQCCTGLESVVLPKSITSISAGLFYECVKLTEIIIPEGVTSIGASAFNSCGALENIAIPASVTIIGERAFSGCGMLWDITLPASIVKVGDKAFEGCGGQYGGFLAANTFIDLPNIEYIGNNVFDCWNLSFARFGKNLKSIGENNFRTSMSVIHFLGTEPPAVKEKTFPEVVQNITVIVPDAKAEKAFKAANVWKDMVYTIETNSAEVIVEQPGDIDFELIEKCDMMPAKVVSLKVNGNINDSDFDQMRVNMKALLHLDLSDTKASSIPENAFLDKTALLSVKLPNATETIGYKAFCGCGSLVAAENIDRATSIGGAAFANTKLSAITLNPRLKSIGAEAFLNTPLSQRLDLPETLEEIGASSFRNTGINGHLTIPESVMALGEGAFAGTDIATVFIPAKLSRLEPEVFSGCANLDIVYIPDNINEIGASAFAGCKSMYDVRLSQTLTSIGERAFSNSGIGKANLPEGITVINPGTFERCYDLTSVIMPSGLKSIEDYGLGYCTGMRSMSVLAKTPPTVAPTGFYGIHTDNCLISIPTDAYRAYVTAEYWGQFVQVRNDIAIETEGDGELEFENTTPEAEVTEPVDAAAFAPRHAAMREATDNAVAVQNGHSVYIPKEGSLRFRITPASGEKIISVTYNGKDVTSEVKDGYFVPASINKKDVLHVKFSGDSGVDKVCANGGNVSNDIFNLQGVCLKRNASQADIDALDPGIYIIAGKKVFVR